MVGVVAHERREVEGCGESGLAVGQEVTEAFVGIFSRTEASELAHGPKAAAVHGGVNAAGVGRFARVRELRFGIPVGKIGFRVEAANRMTGESREFFLPLGRLRQSESESIHFPGFFFG